MSSLLVVGQAPSRVMRPGDRPFEGTRALPLLANYAGVSPVERLYEIADFDNVITEYPGPSAQSPKYDAFPASAALHGASRLKRKLEAGSWTDVVVLGRAGSTAMGFKSNADWYTAIQLKPGQVIWCCPHPGGTSMYWNDPRNRAAGAAFLRRMFAKHDPSKRSTDAVMAQPMSERRIQF